MFDNLLRGINNSIPALGPVPSGVNLGGSTNNRQTTPTTRITYTDTGQVFRNQLTNQYDPVYRGSDGNLYNIASNGNYVRFMGTPINRPASRPTTSTSSQSSRPSTGAVASAPAPRATQPRNYTARELAEMHDINYDVDYILSLLNQGTDQYLENQRRNIARRQDEQLRAETGVFSEYLQSLRDGRSNAVATGMNKGMAAAQEVLALLGGQQIVSQGQRELGQEAIALLDEAELQRSRNPMLAQQEYNNIGQMLAQLGSTLNATDVQRYIGELAAQAELAAAQTMANAQVQASRYNPNLEYAQWIQQNYPSMFTSQIDANSANYINQLLAGRAALGGN